MKKVILSADSDRYIYLVPDQVADNLSEYCLYFCNDWLRNSPDAKKYHKRHETEGFDYYEYTEADFIDYLNNFVFPEEQSKVVENLGFHIPDKYIDLPEFNF